MAQHSLEFKVPAAVSAPMLTAGSAPGCADRPEPADAAAARAHELAHPHESLVWRATGYEDPVFLDRTGRRRPALRLAGLGAALLSTAWLAAVVTGAMGFSDLPGASSAGGLPAVVAPVPTSAHSPRMLAVAPAQRRRVSLAADRDRSRRDADRGPRVIRV